jgi:myosin heavy subunit
VTQRDSKERNYHVFYQLLRGNDAQLLRDIQILSPHSTDYRYLCWGHEEAKDLKDLENFNEMMQAFHEMGFTSNMILDIFSVISAILHMGNLDFTEIDLGEACLINRDDPESLKSFEIMSSLLGIDQAILSMSLITRTFQSGGMRKSITTVKLNKQKSLETRDSLARNLYDKIFLYIINQINENNSYSKSEGRNSQSPRLIGLLDIFGFEIFQNNSFEQLCINYCNEMLQNHFNFVIFITETKIYEEENIHCDTIHFKPNDPVISKIEESFKLLDEESRIPRGSSKTWFDKLKKLPSDQSGPIFTFPRQVDSFVVCHYAGPVTYLPENFMEKNTEVLSNDLINAMNSSIKPLISKLFQTTDDIVPDAVLDSPVKGGRKSTTARSSQVPSLSKSFQFQLTSLMQMLRTTESHFVRCIKSSSKCRPNDFEATLVHRQLLYSGVFEVVKIQQSGLPSRLKHDIFENRYRCILPIDKRWPKKILLEQKQMDPTAEDETEEKLTKKSIHLMVQFLKLVVGNELLPHLQVGKTMTFMKGREFRLLENKKYEIEIEALRRVTRFLRSRRLNHLFSQIKADIHQYEHNVSTFQLDDADVNIASLKTHCSPFALLSTSGVLDHVVDYEIKHLILVRKQFHIIQTITSLLDPTKKAPITEQSIKQLELLIVEAQDINFNHSSVQNAKSVLKRLHKAQESVALIQNSTDLTSSQLESIVEVLQEYKTLVVGADNSLVLAVNQLKKIQHEIENFVPNIYQVLQGEKLVYDSQTGMLSVPPSAASSSNLSLLLSTTSYETLHSKECKALYTCCQLYEKCRTEVVRDNVEQVALCLQVCLFLFLSDVP